MSGTDKFIIVGSGRSIQQLSSWDTTNHKVVAVNTAIEYPGFDNWYIWAHTNDHERLVAKRDGNGKEQYKQLCAKPEKIIKDQDINNATRDYGGLSKTGYSVTLASAYYVMKEYEPSVIGFIGCDMDYQEGPNKETAFYGIGHDIQSKYAMPDPYKMVKDMMFRGEDDKVFKAKRDDAVKSIYNIFYKYATEKGIKVVNYSSVKNPLLPYPQEQFRK